MQLVERLAASGRRSETDATERVDAYWSRFLDVSASVLRTPGVVVTPHGNRLRGYRGVWFFVRDRSAVVSAPVGWVARLEEGLRSAASYDLLSADAAARVIDAAVDEVIGPSFQGWLSPESFRPVNSRDVQQIAASKTGPVQVFRSSLPRQEWKHGGIDLDVAPVWASYHGPSIVSLGQLRPHPDGAVDPCIVTHPSHRRRGHALRLVSAMTEAALSQERLILYQTLSSNLPALSIARRLGFAQYANLVAVRLTPEVG